MDLVEKVARAIFREGFHADEPESVVNAKWDEWPESRQQCRGKARAAVAIAVEECAKVIECGCDRYHGGVCQVSVNCSKDDQAAIRELCTL